METLCTANAIAGIYQLMKFPIDHEGASDFDVIAEEDERKGSHLDLTYKATI